MEPTKPNSEKTRLIYYALFDAHPATNPPFTITLGAGIGTTTLNNCQNIPDGVEKIKEYSANHKLGTAFVLLYPIYMDAMGTDSESTMHSIAWLIKDQADANGWNFDRIGGLTGKTEKDFISEI